MYRALFNQGSERAPARYAVRNLLDRSYGTVSDEMLGGKNLYFLFQGASPTKEQLAAGDYTMGRYAALYGMKYKGMAATRQEAAKLAAEI